MAENIISEVPKANKKYLEALLWVLAVVGIGIISAVGQGIDLGSSYGQGKFIGTVLANQVMAYGFALLFLIGKRFRSAVMYTRVAFVISVIVMLILLLK